jgi:E3 ubiquitin-protein ligase MYCBP2
MAIYAYFMCFKCKSPYFGGRKNCAEAMNEQNVEGFNEK